MLNIYFESPYTLNRLRSGIFGGYIDGFAQALHDTGYAKLTARRYLRAGAHFGHFVELNNIPINSINRNLLQDFQCHVLNCTCPQSNGGTTPDIRQGAIHFVGYLQSIGFDNIVFDEKNNSEPEIIKSFRHWLVLHKAVSKSTEYKYCRGASALVHFMGEDTFQYSPQKLRKFVLHRSTHQGVGATKTLVAALRIFLRYLASQNLCVNGLEAAIPAIARWRHTTLPVSLKATEVERILDACDNKTTMGIRDRAIILLLARLGLRAGDVAELLLTDIDWKDGSLLVSGKTRRHVRLPLPQEVGDAILKYLEHRQHSEERVVFLRSVPPYRGFKSGSSLSPIVTRAMHRAGVNSSRYGAHILRNTLATEMLCEGNSLYEIGAVLRHQSIDMSNHYTKVNTELLQLVVQPWPEVLL